MALHVRYAILCGASTSCVERTHGRHLRVFGKTRGGLDLRMQLIELKLATEVIAGTEAALIQQAQRVWSKVGGVARRSGRATRSNRFISGRALAKAAAARSSAAKLSERQWLQSRRLSVARHTRSEGKRSLQEISNVARHDCTSWTPMHQKACCGQMAS